MPNKTQIYAQMADDTARKITGDYLDWAAFLNTSSRLYKYPFHDQLMIYAQRPDATACATYDLWNDTMRRYIRRGSKGIALLTPGPYGMDVRYVFDVSDTGTRRNSRNVEPWALSDEAMEPVRQMLEDQYYADSAMGLEGQIDQIARQQALEYWRNHARDIRDSVDELRRIPKKIRTKCLQGYIVICFVRTCTTSPIRICMQTKVRQLRV